MTDAEIFQREMSGYGGRLAWEQLPFPDAVQFFGFMADRATRLIESARAFLPKLPPIHFDFVDSGAINAYAFKREGRYFIGVTSGALFMLQLVIGRILSDRQLLHHVGKPDEEDESQPILTTIIPDAGRMWRAGWKPITPKSLLRSSYLTHLLYQAELFLVGHEIAHIARGHVDYLASKRGAAFLVEMGQGPGSADDLIERQTLEGDADRRSALAGARSVQDTLAKPDRPAPPWATAPPGLGELAYDWSFAMNTLFRLFGDVRLAGSGITTSNYPPLPVRRRIAMATVIRTLLSPGESDDDPVAAAVGRGAGDAEAAFAAITGTTPSFEGLRGALGEEGRAHEQRLIDCWNGGLRDRLASYAYEIEGGPENDEPPT
jgi:hypothetical protein